MSSDPITAVLDQLAAHREQIHRLDDRENDHFTAISDQITQIAGLIGGADGIVSDGAAVLARLEELDRQVAALTTHAGQAPPGEADGARGGYQPCPAPKWWKLTGQERQDVVDRLRAWVGQVYQPGYGQLAASLGPCWDQHPLCLYALDILAELWSVLYLQDHRTAGLLSAQAEYQTRILPALAEQLITETSRCAHARSRPPAASYTRSTP